MSRSKKGSKGPGWDYWGKREGLGYGAGGRPANKKKEKQAGVQRERAIAKRKLKKELKDDE